MKSNRSGPQQGKRLPDRRNTATYQRVISALTYLLISSLLILSSCLLPDAVGAESMERLFFAPKDRAHLEKLRWAQSGSPASIPSQTDAQISTKNKPLVFALKGTVTKKHGFQALWLNELKYTRSNLPAYVEPYPPLPAGQVLLRVPESGKSYRLRPGQTLDVSTGRVRESYEPAPKTPSTPDTQSAQEAAPSPQPAPPPAHIYGGPSAPKP